MRKLTLALALIASLIASAEYLYFFMDDGGKEWSYAKVIATDGVADNNQILNIYAPVDDSGKTTVGSSIGQSASSETYADYFTEYGLFADLSSYYVDGWSYYVELFSSDDKSVGSTYSLAYASAGQYLYDAGSATGIPGSLWTFAFTAPDPGPNPIPEPTSGMLVLIGASLLALRRKRCV